MQSDPQAQARGYFRERDQFLKTPTRLRLGLGSVPAACV